MPECYYDRSVADNYFEEPIQLTIFSVCGKSIEIENERLAKAFSILSKQRQEVLVLYFFFGYTDREIGERDGRSRTTANYWKLAALKQLRKELEAIHSILCHYRGYIKYLSVFHGNYNADMEIDV